MQDYLAAHLPHPKLCIDATCGNGGDTAFLCRLAGPEGRVLGFDIQPEAIASTRARLEKQGLTAELSATATRTSYSMSGPARRTS